MRMRSMSEREISAVLEKGGQPLEGIEWEREREKSRKMIIFQLSTFQFATQQLLVDMNDFRDFTMLSQQLHSSQKYLNCTPHIQFLFILLQRIIIIVMMTLKDKHFFLHMFNYNIVASYTGMLSRGNFFPIIHKYFFNEINSNKLNSKH